MKKSVSRKAAIVGEYIIKSGSKINCAAIGTNSCGVFCTGDDSKNVCIWAMQSQMPIKVLSGHNSEISSLIFSQDEKYAFAGTDGGSIVVWDLAAQKIAQSLKEHRNSCLTMGIPQGCGNTALASGSQDTTQQSGVDTSLQKIEDICNVKIWDLRSGRSSHTFKEHNGAVNSVCFSPSNQWVSSAGDDGIIKIWNLASGKLLGDLQLGESPVCHLMYNPVYYTLASSHSSKMIRYWDLEYYKLISESTLDTSVARRIAFFPGGKYLASASSDGVKIWALDSLKLVDTKDMPNRKIEDMAMSTEENCLYVASSFAHSLGIYSVPFDSINYDLNAEYPSSMEPRDIVPKIPTPPRRGDQPTKSVPMTDIPMYGAQGNIITTKAEGARPAPHQFNPNLVMRAPPTASDPTSTIIQRPGDKPINLDMNSFLSDTHKTKTDLDIINEIKKDHTSIMAIVSKRQGNISLIMKYWCQGDIKSALSYLNMTNEISIVMDVFNSTFAEGLCTTMLTLDHLVIILPLALNLVKSKYDCYILAGLKTIERMFKQFGNQIMAAKNVPLMGGVDLAREERLKKGESTIEQFKAIFESSRMKKISEKTSESGKVARRIMTDLEYFLKSCSNSQTGY